MPAPPASLDPRYRSLDVWRGLACLMVVIDHVAIPWFVPGETSAVGGWEGPLRSALIRATRLGWGPPMFFVMSGYCIAASVDSIRRKGKPPGEFLARRLWRTFPPYWMAVALTLLLTGTLDAAGLRHLYHDAHGWLPSPKELDAAHWLGNLTLSETWRSLIVGGEALHFTGISWTLCFQEQFYAVCFLGLLLAPRRLDVALGLITVATIAVRILLWDCGALWRYDGLFLAYWHEFAAGLLAYWRLNLAPDRARRHLADLALAGLAVAAIAHRLPSTLVATNFALLMIALRPLDARLGQARWLAPIRACGKRSYSIYLAHMPACILAASALDALGWFGGFWGRALVGLPLVSAAAVAFAWGLYRLVESRFLAPPAHDRPRPLPGEPAAAQRPVLGAAA